MFSGDLPTMDSVANHGDHLHQVFVNTMQRLELILDGYCLPDPYFKDHLQATVDVLMKCLRDPALPLFELQVKSVERHLFVARAVRSTSTRLN